jgi:hypothetical protein
MQPRQRRYSLEEHARRGEALYHQQIRPLVEAGNIGKIVAIDIETGSFEMDPNDKKACDRLFARCPDAQIWCVRIGYPAVDALGCALRENPR